MRALRTDRLLLSAGNLVTDTGKSLAFVTDQEEAIRPQSSGSKVSIETGLFLLKVGRPASLPWNPLKRFQKALVSIKIWYGLGQF